jgi:hypothetical protein
MVITIDLWALWIPGQLRIKDGNAMDDTKIFLTRALNISIGLLLLTPDNPIYTFLSYLKPAAPYEY